MRRFVRYGLRLAVVLALASGGRARAGYMFQTIDVPGATDTHASGINGAGQIVGSTTTAAATPRLPGHRRGLHDHRRAGGRLHRGPRHQRPHWLRSHWP